MGNFVQELDVFEGYAIARLSGQAAASQVPSLEPIIRQTDLDKIEEQQIPVVLLDFTALQFMGSMAIGSLVRLQKVCKEKGVRLMAYGINELILKALKLSGLDRIFEIYATEAMCHDAI